MSSLLDQQPSRQKLLYEQVEQLSARGTSNPKTLADHQEYLEQLEEEAEEALAQNDKLECWKTLVTHKY